MRRGLTNRAYEQICREVGSAGGGSALFAVAVAAAVYPNAVYGTEQWDQFNPMLPRPIVDPATAGKISEAWVDHRQMTWEACVSRLYGRDPTKLLDPPEDHQPATRSKRVDPSMMETEVGKRLAGQVNRGLEASDTRTHRLNQVLKEYLLFERNGQLDLAEAAIVWAMASLAMHPRRSECESNLHAFSDIMYTSTDDAEHTQSESERQLVVVSATAVLQHLVPGVGQILNESQKRLAAIDKEHLVRMTAEMLHRLRYSYLEHAPTHLLPTLIGRCLIMCRGLDGLELGMNVQAELTESIQNVVRTVSDVIDAVMASIKCGELVVRDGAIVKPTGEDDDEV